MKKVILTLVIGLFFVTFSNAQSGTKLKAAAKEEVKATKGKSKSCCATKKSSCDDKKSKASCAGKSKASCATKKSSCSGEKAKKELKKTM